MHCVSFHRLDVVDAGSALTKAGASSTLLDRLKTMIGRLVQIDPGIEMRFKDAIGRPGSESTLGD